MRSLDVRFSGYAKPYKISGDYGERDPPVPMPNTEVKPFSADGTWLETTWESRTLPDSMKKKDLPVRVGLSFHITRKSYFQIIPTNVQHCTWLGFFLPPAVRDAGRKNHMGEWEEERERNVFHFGCNVLMLWSFSMKSENVLG